MLRTFLIRSDLRPVFGVLSSGAMVWTNTKEASPTELLVPTPALVFGVKSTGVAAFGGSALAACANPTSPAPAKAASEAEPAEASGAHKMPEALVGDVKEGTAERNPSPSSEPAAQTPLWAEALEQPPADAAAPKIHLSIDSLPHLQLIEAFPVTVAQMGDKLYTATTDVLGLSGTSATLTEALVTVKEEIETLYERLIKSTQLDADEKRDLQYLQAHVKSPERSFEQAREHKRGLWR